MMTTAYEETESARHMRLQRWRKRGLCTARPLSARLDRAAAILLRAALNYQRAHRRALLPSRHIELGHLWDACDELHGGRPPRGVLLGREAIEVARQIKPAMDGPGGDYPLLTLEEIKTAWWLARSGAEAARQRETRRILRVEVALATRKFFSLMARLCPPAGNSAGSVPNVPSFPALTAAA
jgi:hypothetical protein